VQEAVPLKKSIRASLQIYEKFLELKERSKGDFYLEIFVEYMEAFFKNVLIEIIHTEVIFTVEIDRIFRGKNRHVFIKRLIYLSYIKRLREDLEEDMDYIIKRLLWLYTNLVKHKDYQIIELPPYKWGKKQIAETET